MKSQIKYSLLPFNTGTSDLNWRPHPIRTPFLLFFIAVCIALIVSIELIVRKCSPDGCPIIGTPSPTSLPAATSFVYNYLPTIISVLFGLLWAAIHHDFMRMEPWFQMSKPGGAKAEDSLLLEYSYLFPLLAPVEAVKRRHYIVLTSCIILLLTTLGVTPLASGIFDDDDLILSIDTNTTISWKPINASAAELTAQFGYMAYSHAWLNGSLPPFVTEEYALAPWKSNLPTTNETWVGTTFIYEGALNCTDATRTPIVAKDIGRIGLNLTSEPLGVHYNLWDESILEDGTSNFTSLESEIPEFERSYLQFQTNTTWTSLTVNEKSWGTNTYLYIFARTPGPIKNGTSALPDSFAAIYCTPEYTVAPVLAAVDMPSGDVREIKRSTSKEHEPVSLSDYRPARLFFTLINDALIGVADRYLDSQGELVGLGYTPLQLPSVDSQLRRRFGDAWDVSGMQTKAGMQYVVSNSSVFVPEVRGFSAFALFGERNETLGGLVDGRELARVYGRAFKMLWALQWSTDLFSGEEEEMGVVRMMEVMGYRANALWARGLQAGLGVVAGLVVGLVVAMWGRRCMLDGEMNSMAEAMGILGRSEELTREMEGAEFCEWEVVRKAWKESGRRYCLSVKEGEGPRIEVVGEEGAELNVKVDEVWKREKVWPVSVASGVAFVGFFGIVGIALVAVFAYAERHNGLPMPAPTNSFGYKVLFSYLPTTLGLAAEPLLGSLGAYYCMLGPYKALHRGNARSDKSLALDYDKSPPHFQLIRSMRAGDIALGGLTSAILLSSVLAVALAGLFSPRTAQLDVELPVVVRGLPVIKGLFTVPAQEMYYTLSANRSGDIPPPSWTTPEYYILPFNVSFHPSNTSSSSVLTASASTYGLGASISCSLVPDSKISQTCSKDSNNFTSTCPASLIPDGNTVTERLVVDDPCFASVPYWLNSWSEKVDTSFDWLDPSADFFVRSLNCSDTFFAVWTERPAAPNPSNYSNPYQDHTEAAVIKCTSAETAVELTATVDKENNVLGVRDVKPLSSEDVAGMYLSGIEKGHRLAPSFIDVIRAGIRTEAGTIIMHDIKWFNYLMANLHPSIVRDVRPNITHIPDTTILTSAFEDVYKRLFAINLRLYSQDILYTPSNSTTTATATITEQRVQVSKYMFIIACTILVFTIVLLVVLYWGPGPGDIAHAPTSLLGMWTALYASNVKDECGNLRGSGPKERAKRLREMSGRYGYGEFVGEEGRRHVGVFWKGKEGSGSIMS